ncbi:MAG: cellulase family glycosylhydrolase [Lachnospiraceae bacterium]|nr:cellulase family glycosylhydrolase [Lachnospiraceae bacterium]
MKRKNYWKQLIAGLAAGVLLLSGLPVLPVFAAENTQTVSSQMPFRELSADEMVAEMGNGWNLGNTMDGHTGFTPSETLWQNVETTQGLMKALHDLGFNTVRVPVTWGTMIDDENNYQIDEQWMSRVQDIVDYCVNMNMYVIINVHHDGAEQAGWLHIAAEDLDPIKEKYAAVWEQIAERFKDYDEHVIFESMNEVTGGGSAVAEDTAIICDFNQIFVDTVRATGSNNAYRWLSVPGRYTNIYNTTDPAAGFKLPTDIVENRLFVAVHYYDWNFGLLENAKTNDFSDQKVTELSQDFQRLIDTFTSQGIPVILGEYGAINKNNTENRAYHMEIVTRMCGQAGVVPCYWDQGWYDLSMEPDFSFTLIDRETYAQVYPEIISAMMRGLFLPGAEDYSDIERSPAIKEISDLGTFDGTYLLHMGEVSYIDLSDRVDKLAYNDVILWKSADETVATVNPDAGNTASWGAFIHAAGIGDTVITAYSQSGKAMLEIPVEVRAAVTATPCTGITLEQDSYTMTAGESLYLNAAMAPADTDAFLTYRSSDPSVVTVSKIGKLVAQGKGSAYVIITASDGLTKVVPVTVEESEISKEILLALNVYFNDSTHNYFSNEYGNSISVREDGQYTLSFDCAQDLSSAATNAGVTGLNDLTAIYIKDDSVTRGRAQKSPLVSCDIFYDSIKVDGVELAVHMDGPKSAIKASGILDTNDPINSWDGSVIEEVSVSNHVLNFTTVTNPQKVEVTFTISNLVFDEGAEMPEAVEASAIEAAESNVSISSGEPAVITAKISPADAGKVTFVSSDASIVSVSNQGMEDANGSVSVNIYAHGNGEAVIIAYTTNGLTAEFSVSAEISEDESFLGEDGQDSSGAGQQQDATQSTEADGSSQNSGIVSTILLILGAIALGAGAFFGALKLAGGKKE